MVHRVLTCGFAALLSAGCATPGPITEIDTGASALEALGPRRTAAGSLGRVFGARAPAAETDDFLVDPMGEIAGEGDLGAPLGPALEQRQPALGSTLGASSLAGAALAPAPQIDSGYVPAPEVLFASDAAPLTSDPGLTPLSEEFIGFDVVTFATDSSELSYEAQAVLERQAAWLLANMAATAVVEGHCDERGTRDYNLALGQRRAEAALDYLAAAGVDSSRLRAVSYGKERPLADALCSAPSCWSRNRRAVTVVQNLL